MKTANLSYQADTKLFRFLHPIKPDSTFPTTFDNLQQPFDVGYQRVK